MEILSMYDVYVAKTGEVYEEAIEGCGQEAIEYLRKEYPRWSRFVLTGFEINGEFKPLRFWGGEKK